MACFIVGGAEAVAVTGIRAHVKKHEVEQGIVDEQGNQLTSVAENGYCMTTKLGWLQTMLAGGAALLCVEHIWHGEVSFVFPFLTAMNSAAETAVMLREMATVGVGMAALVTCAWFAGCAVADYAAKMSARRAIASAEA